MEHATTIETGPEIALNASERMKEYFSRIQRDCLEAYRLAKEARRLGYDPEEEVSAQLTRTLAERVIGLISVIAPQIKNTGVEERIEELEKEFGTLDWRVSLLIAHEIAQQKFCAFEDQLEAITIGVRVGFAYHTLGVVSAPLEGLTSIEVKKRLDGKGEYFCLHFAGPIRNAGGTAASVCVLIADYVRKKMGYASYDPTEKEMLRCPAEIADYHNYITNLQYFPSEEESLFMLKHLPVEIGGDPSERYEVSNTNLKDLPRVPTNKLRSGYCLIHSSCIPLKAPKLWKQLSKWGAAMDLGHWGFLEEFLKVQKRNKAAGKAAESAGKIAPDYTYIKDLVAGRPVLSYPLRHGGFRLRYGRSRASGYSGQAIHPATMAVLDDYIASATQCKVERPGKAAAFMPCDTIEGPIVKLSSGEVVCLNDEEEARALRPEIAEILYLGDVLINYGDFYDRNHSLVPAGYCEEWWVQELERAIAAKEGQCTAEALARLADISVERASLLLSDLSERPSAIEALAIAKATQTPLHPSWTPHFRATTMEDFAALLEAFPEIPPGSKRTLELLGIPHKAPEGKIEFAPGWHDVLCALFASKQAEGKDPLEAVNSTSKVRIMDKSGTFIGARMGRPEKAKMRKLTGSPHGLFPIGEEGGRLRSIQEALQRGKVTAEFPLRHCTHCKFDTVFGRCERCDRRTEQREQDAERWEEGEKVTVKVTCARQEIDIRRTFDDCLNKIGFKIWPDLIKGVRGTSNKSHIPEHLIKGILRAKHEIHVNKDGTTRYDCSEATLTHFKPREANVPVERLRDLGYTHDCRGRPLTDPDQVLELRPQDLLLPCCDAPGYPDEAADAVLFRTANFVDEELERLYGLAPYYALSRKEDLLGHYVVGLAPHTSAGIVGRIVGFSKTQGFLAHPLFHAAMRRDCDGDESCIMLLMDVFLNFSSKFLAESRGSTMDAPLVITYLLNPSEVDDMAFHVDRAWKYPLTLYEAALAFKKPYDVKVELIADVLGTQGQFEGMGFTHDTTDFNLGTTCSAYKILPSMEEKMQGQMALAVKIRACDAGDVARLVIEKHFIRDTKGNLRKFTQQEWRCVACNEKFRRPPLIGRCTACNGKIVFTISEGSIIKYLEPSLSLANAYDVPIYLKQDLELLKRKIEDLFGKDKEKQEALEKWFG